MRWGSLENGPSAYSLVFLARIAVTYSPPSTRRSQRLFWKLMDEAPDAHREQLDIEVDE